MTFRVGQLVVRVTGPEGSRLGGILPKRGGVYTVRDIFEYEGETLLRLREIVNPKQNFICGFMEGGYIAGHFRPIVSENKHIAAFRQMLKNSKDRNNAELLISLAERKQEKV